MTIKRPKLVGDAITVADNNVHVGTYGDYTLYSAYQPIWSYDAVNGFFPYGYEGLIRPKIGDENIQPLDLFNAIPQEDALFIECMCHALHLRNYNHCQPNNQSLFFNINSNNYPSIEAFEANFKFLMDRLPYLGISRENIILEVVETEQGGDGVLMAIRDFARKENIRLAIDDFGQDCSTVERYLDFMPEIVKVDRDVFKNACDSLLACKLLHTIIEQFHEHGTTVLIEGIESKEQFEVATTLGADLYQGFLLGRPQILPTQFSKPVNVADNQKKIA